MPFYSTPSCLNQFCNSPESIESIMVDMPIFWQVYCDVTFNLMRTYRFREVNQFQPFVHYNRFSTLEGIAGIRFSGRDTVFCWSAVHINKTTKCRQL